MWSSQEETAHVNGFGERLGSRIVWRGFFSELPGKP